MTSEGTFRSCNGRTRQTSLLHSFLPVYPATNRLLSNLAEQRQHLRSCERTDFFTWTLDLFPEELCCPVDACRFILLLIIKKKKKKGNQELQALVPSTSPTGSQRLADDPTPALLFMSQLTAFNGLTSPWSPRPVLQGVHLAALGCPSAAMAATSGPCECHRRAK